MCQILWKATLALVLPLVLTTAAVATDYCAVVVGVNVNGDEDNFYAQDSTCGYATTDAIAEAKRNRFTPKEITCEECERVGLGQLGRSCQWKVQVIISCGRCERPIKVTMAGTTYCEALNSARSIACMLAREQNCSSRYRVCVLQRP